MGDNERQDQQDGDEKRGGLFSRLSDALFEEVPQEQPDPLLVNPAPKAAAPPAQPKRPPIATTPAKTKDSPALLAELKAAFEKDGDSLGTFLTLVESFKAYIPDEDKRYAAAAKALMETTGKKKTDLMQAIQKRTALIKVKREEFGDSLKGQREELKALAGKSDAMLARIEAMRKEVDAMVEQHKKLLAQVASGEGELKETSEKFEQAAKVIEAEVAQVAEKIQKFLA